MSESNSKSRRWLLLAVILVGAAIVAGIWFKQAMRSVEVNPQLSGLRDASTASAYQYPKTYDDHLAQLRPFPSSAGTIAYLDSGPAAAPKTVVLIHGVPTSSWMYRKLIDRLQQEVRVIAIDLLGYGASAKPRESAGVYSHVAQAGYVTELMSSLMIDEYAVLVHDMGGLVGWELLKQSAPVSEMILLNTIIQKQGFNPPEMERGMMTEAIMKAYTAPVSSVKMLQSTFDELGLTDEHTLTEAECEGYVRPLQSGSDSALYEFFTSLKDSLPS